MLLHAVNLLLTLGLARYAPAQQGSAGQGFSSSKSHAGLLSSALPNVPQRAGKRSIAPVVTSTQTSKQVDLYREPVRPFSSIAIGFEAGTLGIGLQAATPLTRTLNLRAGADFLNFNDVFTVDAAQYDSHAHLRSGHLGVDWHPFGGGFRISPELLLFQSGFSAGVFVTAGQGFELGNTAFLSGPTDPIHGAATISMTRSVMPAVTVGFGNMLGQRRRHWSIPIEIGAAYTGHYTVTLNLAGTACLNVIGCMNASSPYVQSSLHREESDLDETMKHFQVYPILGTGFAYRF